MSVSPTQRSLRVLREQGKIYQVVEHWNPFSRRRIDLFGIIDILAIGEWGTLGIQATAGSSHAARREKLLAHPKTATWLSHPGRSLEIWSWSKRKVVKRGKKLERWTLRVEPITPEMLSRPSAHPSSLPRTPVDAA